MTESPPEKRALWAALISASVCLALIIGVLFGLRPDLPSPGEPTESEATASVASAFTRSATRSVPSDASPLEPNDEFADTFVKGVVRSTEDSPVSEAIVQLEDRLAQRTRETRSDAAGRFAFRGVPPGHYRLRADAVGFMPIERAFRRLRVPEDDEFELALEPSGILEGVVLGDGKPLADARVFVRSHAPNGRHHSIETKSDAAGRFVADPVPLTGLTLGASHEDYASDWVRIDELLPDGDVPVPGARSNPIALSRFGTIELRRGLRVHGVVVSEDGSPIEGARIGTFGPTSATDGRFSFQTRALPISLEVSARGFVNKSVRAETSELNIVLETGRIGLVRVLDAAGRAVPGARVKLSCSRGGGPRGKTNNSGEVELNGIPAGPCAAHVEHIAHPKGLFHLNESVTEHTFSLAPPASLRGRVLSGGRSVSRYGYQLRGPVRLSGRVVSESGSLDLDPIEGGAYVLTLWGAGLLRKTFHFELQEGEHRSGVSFELAAEARVHGRASREGDSVELTDSEDRISEWRNVDPDGDSTWKFEFDGLPDGHYTLRLRGRDGRTIREQSFDLEVGQDMVIDLR